MNTVKVMDLKVYCRTMRKWFIRAYRSEVTSCGYVDRDPVDGIPDVDENGDGIIECFPRPIYAAGDVTPNFTLTDQYGQDVEFTRFVAKSSCLCLVPLGVLPAEISLKSSNHSRYNSRSNPSY